MANTIAWGERTLTITSLDSDWTWDDIPSPYVGVRDGIYADYITFVPGAIGDKLVLLEKDASGSQLFPLYVSTTTEPYTIYLRGGEGKHIKPFFDDSESTVSSGATIIIGLLR
jgi:hypothetical protein